jgi:predicted aconitase with swiveling domain
MLLCTIDLICIVCVLKKRNQGIGPKTKIIKRTDLISIVFAIVAKLKLVVLKVKQK